MRAMTPAAMAAAHTNNSLCPDSLFNRGSEARAHTTIGLRRGGLFSSGGGGDVDARECSSDGSHRHRSSGGSSHNPLALAAECC